MTDALTAASAEQRAAFAKAMDTLRIRHNAAIAKLANMKVPPPAQVYDPPCERVWLLEHQVSYLRELIETIKPLFEKCAEDAADYCGASLEDFGLVSNAAEDFFAPLLKAAEEQLAASAERRAGR